MSSRSSVSMAMSDPGRFLDNFVEQQRRSLAKAFEHNVRHSVALANTDRLMSARRSAYEISQQERAKCAERAKQRLTERAQKLREESERRRKNVMERLYAFQHGSSQRASSGKDIGNEVRPMTGSRPSIAQGMANKTRVNSIPVGTTVKPGRPSLSSYSNSSRVNSNSSIPSRSFSTPHSMSASDQRLAAHALRRSLLDKQREDKLAEAINAAKEREGKQHAIRMAQNYVLNRKRDVLRAGAASPYCKQLTRRSASTLDPIGAQHSIKEPRGISATSCSSLLSASNPVHAENLPSANHSVKPDLGTPIKESARVKFETGATRLGFSAPGRPKLVSNAMRACLLNAMVI